MPWRNDARDALEARPGRSVRREPRSRGLLAQSRDEGTQAHGAGGGVLSGPSPVTDAHEPLISVLLAVSCFSVGNTVPVTSGSFAFRSPAMTPLATRSAYRDV